MKVFTTSLALAIGTLIAAASNAALITAWGVDTANTTLTEGAAGSFSTVGTAGDSPIRALFPAIDFSAVGTSVRATGNATFPNALGNIQFRAGLYDTNGVNTGSLNSGQWSGATLTGWKGYYASPGNAGGADVVVGLNGGAYYSGFGGNYTFGSQGASATVPAGEEVAFSLTLTRLSATAVRVDYSFTGATTSRAGSFVDEVGVTNGNSTSLTALNAIGFLTNNNTSGGGGANTPTQFSNVRVDVIPEPATLTLVGIAIFATTARRRN